MARKKINANALSWFRAQRSRYERAADTVVRELVQNAADSLFLRQMCCPESTEDYRIEFGLLPQGSGRRRSSRAGSAQGDEAGIFIRDTGLGLTPKALESLNEVNESGTTQLLAELAEENQATRIHGQGAEAEGQFGVGIYTTALVGTQVELRSKCRTTGEAWNWTFFPSDFSYELKQVTGQECVDREFGTTVELSIDPDSEHSQPFQSTSGLERIVERVAEFVTWPIFSGARQVNRCLGPWDRDWEGEAGPDDYIAYLRDSGELAEGEEPLFLAPLKWDDRIGLGGVLFGSERSEEEGVKIHVNRYLVDRSLDHLPRGFRWVRGVVFARDVDVNEARERLVDLKPLRRLREQLESWILCGDPHWTHPTVMKPYLTSDDRVKNGGVRGVLAEIGSRRAARKLRQRYFRDLMLSAAARSPGCRAALGRLIELPMVDGSRATLGQVLKEEQADEALHVMLDESCRASAAVFLREGRFVLDATDRVVAQFLRKVADDAKLTLREVGSNVSIQPPDPAKWTPLAELLAQLDVRVTPRFEPLGTTSPFAIDMAAFAKLPQMRNYEDPLFMLRFPHDYIEGDDVRVREQIVTHARDVTWPVLVNVDHELCKELLKACEMNPTAVKSAATGLIAFAISQAGFSWDSDDLRRFAYLHADGLHDLLAASLR